MAEKVDFNIVLFDNFEVLDAFGPAEVISKLDALYALGYYSLSGGLITSAQGSKHETDALSTAREDGVVLIPGGIGTRNEVYNDRFIGTLRELSSGAKYVLTVCTGSALLARTGLIKNIRATSNKAAFDWVTSQDTEVHWVRKARWVVDGKYYTSSGVTAGIDMMLGFVNDLHGRETADRIARRIEYVWNPDQTNDAFHQVDQ